MDYIRYFLFYLCSFFLSSWPAHAEFTLQPIKSIEKTDILTVEEAFQMDFNQEDHQLHIHWNIAPDHYLYQSKFTFTPTHANLTHTSFSAGESYQDDYFGEQIIYRNHAHITLELSDIQNNAQITIGYMGCAEKKLCYTPSSLTLPLEPVTLSAQDSFALSLSQQGFIISLVLFFLLGIGLAFTPCVFPMYPILSSIIVRQQQNDSRRPFWLSLAYVQGMALTYSALGIIVALAGLKYQAALQQPLLLGVLAVIFAILALSMFDVYQIKVPQFIENKFNQISSEQKTGTIFGVFLMGALSGLIASPCTTAPLSGALLYIAQTGDILLGFSALYSLSLGMGLPLLILGSTSGRWLPKAGHWMNKVKQFFGFLLMAVSVMLIARFAPNALIVSLWIIWSLSLIFFLLKSNMTSQASTFKNIRYGMIAVLGLSLGLWLQSDVKDVGQQLYTKLKASQATSNYTLHNDFVLASNLAELDALLLEAKNNQKPVLIDMYAQWCVACKEFESITFQDQRIKNHFKHMKLIKVDVTDMNAETTQILERYQVKGLPTLILFNKNGVRQEQLRVTGFMTPAEFNQQLTLLMH